MHKNIATKTKIVAGNLAYLFDNVSTKYATPFPVLTMTGDDAEDMLLTHPASVALKDFITEIQAQKLRHGCRTREIIFFENGKFDFAYHQIKK